MKKLEVSNIFRELISCPNCNGVGGYLGNSLGYCECETCGGDGHRLKGREGEKLNEIVKIDNGKFITWIEKNPRNYEQYVKDMEHEKDLIDLQEYEQNED